MSKLVNWLANELPKYWKAAIAIVPVVLFVGAEVVQAIQQDTIDGALTLGDVLRIVTVAVASYGVYKKQNARLKG